MSVPIFFDPCPIPAELYAERMGIRIETLVALHLRGEFRALEKIGKSWFVLPARVIQLSLNGDSEEGRQVSGGLQGQDGETDSGLRIDRRGSREEEKPRARGNVLAFANPLE